MVITNSRLKEDTRGQLITGIVLILILGLVVLVGVVNSGFVTESITTQPDGDIEYSGEFVKTINEGHSNVLYHTEKNDLTPTQQVSELDELSGATISQFRNSYVGTFDIVQNDVQDGVRIEQQEPGTLDSTEGDSYTMAIANDARNLQLSPSDDTITDDTILVESSQDDVSSSDAFSVRWVSGSEEYTTYMYREEESGDPIVQTNRNGEIIYVDIMEQGDTFELFTGTKNGNSIYSTQPADENTQITVSNGDSIETALFVVVDPIADPQITAPVGGSTSDTVYSISYEITQQTPQQSMTYTTTIQPCNVNEDVCSYIKND